jgi:hypothetical protein
VDARGRISWRRVLFEEPVARGVVEVASDDEEVPPP